mgnify:CR=1 FL=1|jgi:heat shock protein HtpX
MEYVGILTQQRRNNERSLILLCLFPVLVVALIYLFCYLLSYVTGGSYSDSYFGEGFTSSSVAESAGEIFVTVAPWAIGGVLLWFIIAYFANTSIINSATASMPLSRKDNKRVYDIVENLCMSQGMKMPKINIIDDDSLNAFASGINERNYAITFSKGIIEKLNDEELEAVAGHELSHIRNHDVRLMIISIVFVGIFSMLAQFALKSIYYSSVLGGGSRRSVKGGGGSAGVIIIVLIAVLVAVIGYFFSILMRFAISRKREYLADAGSAEMTKNPLALANALKKISGDPRIEACTRADVAQLFIEHPGPQAGNMFTRLFDTHPPIEKRIQVLEQF